ncbi:MAG: sulfatase-like hydrolase/transferase [Opitutaceae bacterium]|jgi:arylsulfatase A-like enzyme|nr:sulfatase-like hydrolase/transferase [Opitutaceae bacterium]
MKFRCVIWLWFLLFSGWQVRATERPNILFIVTDDQSYRTVSAYPEALPWAHTPNIDRLAERGVRFSRAYVGTWCMPARATMLTGRLQYGVESMRMEGEYPRAVYDPVQTPFWPRVFRENGYWTGQIGKWHTGIDNGFGRDWDHQIVWNRPRNGENAGNYYDNQLLEFNGRPGVMVRGYSTDNYTRWAKEFIEGRDRDVSKPWFLWVCYSGVHAPFTPPDRHLESFPNAEVPAPADIYPPRQGKPSYSRDYAHWVPGVDGSPVLVAPAQQTVTNNQIHGNRLQDWVRQYQQAVSALDDGVGEIMRTLEETGQLDNTLVVFTSDQGYAWGQHGFSHKIAPYDANIRGPLIVSMPTRLPQGVVSDAAIGGHDLPPTFFAFAGLDLPWEMHGHDITPFLHEPDTARPRPLLTALTGFKFGSDTHPIPTAQNEIYMGAGVPWWLSLVDGDFKYIRTLVEGEPEELYDLRNDPEELVNLAPQPDHRERLLGLREALLAELRRTDAALIDSLPGVAVLP